VSRGSGFGAKAWGRFGAGPGGGGVLGRWRWGWGWAQQGSRWRGQDTAPTCSKMVDQTPRGVGAGPAVSWQGSRGKGKGARGGVRSGHPDWWLNSKSPGKAKVSGCVGE
jgi:hypothetical protein